MSEILQSLIKFRNYCITIEVDSEKPMEWKDVGGLCYATDKAHISGILSYTEACDLRDYILRNRPKWYQKHYSHSRRYSSYFWKAYLWLPRILWLEYRIKKERKKQSTV